MDSIIHMGLSGNHQKIIFKSDYFGHARQKPALCTEKGIIKGSGDNRVTTEKRKTKNVSAQQWVSSFCLAGPAGPGPAVEFGL